MNEFYRYPNIELYDEKVWADRSSNIAPLVKWIQETNHEKRLADHPETYTFNDSTVTTHGAVLDEEVVKSLNAQGLTCYSKHCGGLNWLALIPNSIIGKWNNHNRVLVIFAEADYANANWANETLKQYADVNAQAGKDEDVVIYIAANGYSGNYTFVWVMLEVAPCFHLSGHRVYMDVSTIYQNGLTVSQVPNFAMEDGAGNRVDDPDALVELYGELPVQIIEITKIWAHRRSIVQGLYSGKSLSGLNFDPEAILHTENCKRVAEGLALEYNYRTVEDEGVKAYFEAMGVRHESHVRDGAVWHSYVPMCIDDEPEKKLPCLMLMHESGNGSDHETLTGISYNIGLFPLVGQGEFILLHFALEAPDDNDLFIDILHEAEERFPIDRTRVYITGHSHNGMYALEFMRRHHEEITAVATAGDLPGLADPAYYKEPVEVTDEKIDLMSTFDMPLVNLSGYCEASMMYPINEDLAAEKITRPGNMCYAKYRIQSWQRRLKASRCPMKTEAEIRATASSADYVERKLGIPFDQTEVLFLDGLEVYIGDVKNLAGKNHLRMVCFDKLPHHTPPILHELAWSFLKRFERDPKTGEIVELF